MARVDRRQYAELRRHVTNANAPLQSTTSERVPDFTSSKKFKHNYYCILKLLRGQSLWQRRVLRHTAEARRMTAAHAAPSRSSASVKKTITSLHFSSLRNRYFRKRRCRARIIVTCWLCEELDLVLLLDFLEIHARHEKPKSKLSQRKAILGSKPTTMAVSFHHCCR